MIPQFPEFKKLALSDKEEIESFTKQFPPYSDFNFVSMWSWDIKGDMRVAWLHGNLVVKFNDYLTGLPFYSFLGTNQVNDTAAELIEVSKVLGQQAYIGLIPEVTAKLLDTAEFVVTEEVDQFDYIYDLKEQIDLTGKKFATKRYEVSRFVKNYGDEVQVSLIDLNQNEIVEQIKKLNTKWALTKKRGGEAVDAQNETEALYRLLALVQKIQFDSIGLFKDSELIGFSIGQEQQDRYKVCHFSKCDESYYGIYSFLMKQNALLFSGTDFEYYNYEQDLGIPGLRLTKSVFRPCHFLKKFRVQFK